MFYDSKSRTPEAICWVIITQIQWNYYGWYRQFGELSSVSYSSELSFGELQDLEFSKSWRILKIVTGQTRLPLVAKCTLDFWIVLSRVRYWDIFPFRSKCGVISLLTDGVDLLILIMKENTQIYGMGVSLLIRSHLNFVVSLCRCVR